MKFGAGKFYEKLSNLFDF